MNFEIWKFKRANREILKNFKPSDFWHDWQKMNAISDRLIFDFALLEIRAENADENRKRNLRKIYLLLKKVSKRVKPALKIA